MEVRLGPQLRLSGLNPQDLPSKENPDEIQPFLQSLVKEATDFIPSINGSPGNEVWKKKCEIRFSPKKVGGKEPVNVEILQKTMGLPSRYNADSSTKEPTRRPSLATLFCDKCTSPPDQVGTEYWFARRSYHENASLPGTASMAEFRHYMKDNHAQTEQDMTPTVVSGKRPIETWNTENIEIPVGNFVWQDFTLGVYAMRHEVGPLLSDRVFTVLQMTCATTPAQVPVGDLVDGSPDPSTELLVVSVPVNGHRSTPIDATTVPGRYVSFERIRLAPQCLFPETMREAGGRARLPVEWLMATTSDAGGLLPQFVQRPAIPGAIAKDVPLFLTWLNEEREKAVGNKTEGKNQSGSGSASGSASGNGNGNGSGRGRGSVCDNANEASASSQPPN